MKIIVFANQKGGTGKTTLAGHLAVEADREGLGPVVLMDFDPQGALSDWWNVRAAETPFFKNGDLGRLTEQMAELEQAGVTLVVIDSPPALTNIIRTVVAVADLVVVPSRPSPHDVRGVRSIIELVEQAKKPMVFVVNGAAPRAKISADVATLLSQHGKVAPVTVYQRTDFAHSMIDGRTSQEIDPGSPSAKEVQELLVYVRRQLHI